VSRSELLSVLHVNAVSAVITGIQNGYDLINLIKFLLEIKCM